MFRNAFRLLGLLMIAVPRRVIDSAEAVAFENPDEGIRRPWTVPIARVEGLLYLLVAGRARLSSPSRAALGLFGIAATLAPRRYLRFGLRLSYENPDELRPKPWVVPATRAVGLAVLGALLAAARRTQDENDSDGC